MTSVQYEIWLRKSVAGKNIFNSIRELSDVNRKLEHKFQEDMDLIFRALDIEYVDKNGNNGTN